MLAPVELVLAPESGLVKVADELVDIVVLESDFVDGLVVDLVAQESGSALEELVLVEIVFEMLVQEAALAKVVADLVVQQVAHVLVFLEIVLAELEAVLAELVV